MEKIESCIICGEDQFTHYLDCKDHFLSKQIFTIVECTGCGFRFINPRPFTGELGKYYKSESYISHSGTKKGFINKIYLLARKFTQDRKYNIVQAFKSTGSILDIGCGSGELLKLFQKKGWKTVGIEPDELVRKTAINRYSLDIREEVALKKIPDGAFDVITMWHVLEHVPDLIDRVKEVKRILKKDGILIVAVPNCNSMDAKIYGEHWAAYDVPRHLSHFTKDSIAMLFRNHGMVIAKILPMKLDAFYVSMLSEKYKRGKINYFTAAKNGLLSNMRAKKNQNEYSSLIFIIKRD
ncbi:MAG: class I SAM-dependent methyltransferase [Bacteroidales bacterium]|nr:class I SAM-dependent methyltransferase [Bacteroidales bacterium]